VFSKIYVVKNTSGKKIKAKTTESEVFSMFKFLDGQVYGSEKNVFTSKKFFLVKKQESPLKKLLQPDHLKT
jgi:hypothetical protein